MVARHTRISSPSQSPSRTGSPIGFTQKAHLILTAGSYIQKAQSISIADPYVQKAQFIEIAGSYVQKAQFILIAGPYVRKAQFIEIAGSYVQETLTEHCTQTIVPGEVTTFMHRASCTHSVGPADSRGSAEFNKGIVRNRSPLPLLDLETNDNVPSCSPLPMVRSNPLDDSQ